jgi:Flp pilus assembly protein TadG
MKSRSRKTKRDRREQGMELLEMAIVLPLLLVIAAGVMDFGNAWRVRQVLANAAREGARLGSTQPMLDLNTTSPATVQLICQDVANYLARQNVSTTFMNGTNSNPAAGCASPSVIAATSTVLNPVPLGWTYYSSGSYGLKIERTVLVSTSVSGPSSGVSSTQVTLDFPFYWPFGFNRLSRDGTSNGEPTPIPIQVNTVMANTD